MNADVVAKAEMLVDAGNPLGGLRLLAPHLAANPEDPSALNVAAAAHLELEQYGESVRLAHASIALNPHSADAWHVLAFAELRRGRGPVAVDAITTCQQLDPHSWHRYVNCANVRVAAGDISRHPIEIARHGVRLAPNQASAHAALARTLAAATHWDTAEAEFREALRLDPQYADALHGLSRITLERGRVGEAAAGFAEVLRIDPENTTAGHNIKVATHRVMSNLMWAVFLVHMAVCGAARSAQDAAQDAGTASSNPVTLQVILVLAPVAIAAIAAFQLLRVRAGAGDRAHVVARAAIALDPSLGWALGLVIMAFSGTIAAAAIGGEAAAAFYVFDILVLLLPAGLVLQIRANALRR